MNEAFEYDLIFVSPDNVVLENQGAVYSKGDQAALESSREIIGGWVYPPIVYENPDDGRLYCVDGNHRIMVLRNKGWGKTPIPMLRARVPKSMDEDNLLEWRLLLRSHANSKRRSIDDNEWKALFEQAQMDLGWTQAQIASQFHVDPADVSRILSDKMDDYREKKSEREKAQRRTYQVGRAQETPSALIERRLSQARKRDEDAIRDLRMLYWTIGRQLLQLGIDLPDPRQEDFHP